ncbi:MAG: WhiB family transcriptional regulator [Mycolicibacterium sp.]|uniref:WhiB family transcriptional regulator n=1 Tax=Mycolicibacterium sp. TaxID=2320850 RepID=UPI003D121730
MNAVTHDDAPVGACTAEPERWTTFADDEAKIICRACPRRWMCARDACELPRAEGLWAGIYVPEGGRGRTFALRQLKSLAERNGYPVRTRRIYCMESA